MRNKILNFSLTLIVILILIIFCMVYYYIWNNKAAISVYNEVDSIIAEEVKETK